MPDIVVHLYAGYSRPHPYVADILMFFALMSKATNDAYDPEKEQSVRLACSAANADIVGPIGGFVEAASTGDIPDLIDLYLVDNMPIPDEADALLGIKSLSTRIIGAIFTLFVERANDWVRFNVSSDYNNWPPVSNFTRVVRNAIVHGGTININSEAAPVVKWREVTFSHHDFGREVLSQGLLSPGDLLVLMVELDQELNSLSAPFDLG